MTIALGIGAGLLVRRLLRDRGSITFLPAPARPAMPAGEPARTTADRD